MSSYHAIIDKIAKDLHDGKITSKDISQDLINQTYNDLIGGVSDGFGPGFTKFGKDAGSDAAVLEMHKNVYRFSHAKSMAQLHEINKALYDGEQIRQLSDFKTEVEKINVRYNRNYLETEYHTARNAAEHARKWQEYQEDAALFPNLKYMTVADDRVRDEHQVLHGVIKPIDDDFWNNYYPPNGWNCRCYTVQTAEKADQGKYEDKTVPQTFMGNVGKTGVIFSKGQSFFQIAKELGTNETNKAFELSKLEVPLLKRYKSPTGAKVNVSPWTDNRPDELAGNYKVAMVLADKEKLNVDLLAHLDGWVVKGQSNPEYRINGKMADRKAPGSTNYKKSLSRANEQGCEIVVIDLSKNKDTIENAAVKIDNVLKLDVHTKIKEVYIVSSDRKTVKHYKRKKQS